MSSKGRKKKQPQCLLCGHSGMVLDRRLSEPICLNQTRCRRRRMTQEVRIRQFVNRLRRMPPDTRYKWIAAIRKEFMPKQWKRLDNLRRKSAGVENSGSKDKD